jgi:hypothetical protein
LILDLQIDVLANEMQAAVPHENSRQQASFAQDLKAVAFITGENLANAPARR